MGRILPFLLLSLAVSGCSSETRNANGRSCVSVATAPSMSSDKEKRTLDQLASRIGEVGHVAIRPAVDGQSALIVVAVPRRDDSWGVDARLREFAPRLPLSWACPGGETDAARLATTDKLVTVSSHGYWSLRRLGYRKAIVLRDLDVPRDFPVSRSATRSAAFALPSGAAQARGGYYLLRVHYRLRLDPKSGDGEVIVYGDVNYGASAMIDFELNHRLRGGLVVRRHGMGLVGGSFNETEARLVWEGTYENFVQDKGIRPGPGALWFTVAAQGQAKIRELRIFPDSGIRYQPGGPADVKITLRRLRDARR